MQNQFRLFLRGSVYYSEDRTGRQKSLKTRDEAEAQQLIQAANMAANQPAFNRAMAKSYLTIGDPKITTRTWADLMVRFCDCENPATRSRHERFVKSKPMIFLRDKTLLDTTADDLFQAIKIGTKSTVSFLQTLHNDAYGIGWLLAPILHPKKWPKKTKSKRKAITAQQHKTLVETFRNNEWRLYLELLWHTGASQTDGANLTSTNIDWKSSVLRYDRQKLKGRELPPACLKIGKSLAAVLSELPSEGPLFPKLSKMDDRSRSCLIWKRCKRLGFKNISLHSYRYAWAQRAQAAGVSERFAKAALGHNSDAVHNAYARDGEVICPEIDLFEENKI